MDTGLVLQLRAALDVIDADLARLVRRARVACAEARTHAAGGAHLAAAGAAGHARPEGCRLVRPRSSGIASASLVRERASLTLQFGGAVGTLAALGRARPERRRRRWRAELKLALPDIPWHAQRDRIAEVATTLGLLVGTLGKIARDVSLLDADRSRRGVRAGRARTRRLVDDAAQAQSGRLGGDARRRDARARARRDDARAPWCRSTSAASAAGTRNGKRCPRSACSAAGALARRRRRSSKVSRSTPGGWPPISRSRTG